MRLPNLREELAEESHRSFLPFLAEIICPFGTQVCGFAIPLRRLRGGFLQVHTSPGIRTVLKASAKGKEIFGISVLSGFAEPICRFTKILLDTTAIQVHVS